MAADGMKGINGKRQNQWTVERPAGQDVGHVFFSGIRI